MELGKIDAIRRGIDTAKVPVIAKLHELIFEETGDRKNRKRLREFKGFVFNDEKLAEKINYVKSNFETGDLVMICGILCLDYNGTDDEVTSRILDALLNIEALSKEICDVSEDDDDADEEKEDDEVSHSKDGKKSDEDDVQRSKVKNTRRNDECPGRRIDEDRRSTGFPISFRDVEDSLRTFSGSDDVAIERWVEEFEEMSRLMGWGEIQMFIFAKKSLRGLAKLFMQSEKNATSWSKVRQALLEEFSSKVNSAQLHSMLSTRKMKRGESVHEYFLIMREMAL